MDFVWKLYGNTYAVHVTVALVGVATLNLALPPPWLFWNLIIGFSWSKFSEKLKNIDNFEIAHKKCSISVWVPSLLESFKARFSDIMPFSLLLCQNTSLLTGISKISQYPICILSIVSTYLGQMVCRCDQNCSEKLKLQKLKHFSL